MRERFRQWAAECRRLAGAVKKCPGAVRGAVRPLLRRHRAALAAGAAALLLFLLLGEIAAVERTSAARLEYGAAARLEADLQRRQNQDLQAQVEDLQRLAQQLGQESRDAGTEEARVRRELEELREEVSQGALWLRAPLVYREHDFPEGIVPGGRPAVLTLEMLGGSYDPEDGYWNSTWSGRFQFRVHFEGGEDDEDVISGPFGFGFGGRGEFQFLFRDYNRDGEPDFALGQWGALSAGDYYGIFTVRETGVVELLPFAGDRRRATAFGLVDMAETDHTHAFFYPHDHSQSMLFDLLDVPGFSITYTAARGPENVILEEALEQLDAWMEGRWLRGEGGMDYHGRVRDVYEWQGDCFRLVRQELLDLD